MWKTTSIGIWGIFIFLYYIGWDFKFSSPSLEECYLKSWLYKRCMPVYEIFFKCTVSEDEALQWSFYFSLKSLLFSCWRKLVCVPFSVFLLFGLFNILFYESQYSVRKAPKPDMVVHNCNPSICRPRQEDLKIEPNLGKQSCLPRSCLEIKNIKKA